MWNRAPPNGRGHNQTLALLEKVRFRVEQHTGFKKFAQLEIQQR